MLLSVVSLAFLTLSCARIPRFGSDQAWHDQPGFRKAARPALYPGTVLTSRHLTMRDGVRIAIDLYLPQGLRQGEKIPAILLQTRYVRGMLYRWPFSHFLHGRFEEMIRHFVTRGYAWVYLDARGSGASFGTRSYPYAPDEVLDGVEISNWITRQPWSDGKVGSIGSSYDGDAAVFLLATGKSTLKAVMPRYAYFDAYPEVVRPGGIHLRWLTETWGRLGKALDADRIGDFLGWRVNLAVRGIRPVDADRDGSLLAAAVAERAGNGDVTALALDIEFRDDRSREIDLGIEQISPHLQLAAIRETGVPVYFYTGWFDASYVLSEVTFFRSLEGQQRKLTIGPWDHGGWTNVSPYARTHEPCFDHDAEALRFFDATLEGADNGIFREKPVAYYTMGAEQWRFADNWPPAGTKPLSLYFAPGHSLSTQPPARGSGVDTHETDRNTKPPAQESGVDHQEEPFQTVQPPAEGSGMDTRRAERQGSPPALSNASGPAGTDPSNDRPTGSRTLDSSQPDDNAANAITAGPSASPDAAIHAAPAGASDTSDPYQVDYSTGTGTTSRWVSLVNPMHVPTRYPDRRKQDRKLLCYDTAPLQEPLEVTGHPIVTLCVSSTTDDGAFFVYLEDVGPDGTVTYITEGMLRAIHRKLSDEPPPYPTPLPYRTFLRRDAMPLVPGQVAELVFDLYPTSYLFKEGHAIRVAIAGADKDHFAFVPEQPPAIRMHRSPAAASRIDLPVMRRDR